MGEWIEHDGMGLPVPVGTMVQVKLRNGEIEGPFGAGTIHPGHYQIVPEWSKWHWAMPSCRAYFDGIIAYRLSDTDDKAKREARIELFRGIAKSKEFLIEETLKPREKVK